MWQLPASVIRGRSRWALAVATIALLALTGFFLCRAVGEDRDTLRLCLGEEAIPRTDLIETVEAEAKKCGLHLVLSAGTRREASVKPVARGGLDAAIVFGGLGIDHPKVRQVACLR